MSDLPLSRHSRRLLETLVRDGAVARENAARPGHLAVSAPKGAVTTVIASVPTESAGPLVERNLAQWRGTTLAISPEGRAFARRLASPADADPYQTQHRELVRETRELGEAPVSVDANESPLAWLARRRDRDGKPFLDSAAVAAGERFRRDITVAQMLPSVTSNWSQGASARSDPTRQMLPSEVAVAARQRVDNALDAVRSDFAGLILDTCAFVKKLETIEAERGWPARSAKIVLRFALADLARHYGLSASARGPRTSRGIRRWHAGDDALAMAPSDER